MSMTEKERAEIRRHVNDREKLAHAMAVERSAALLVEFEQKIAASYSWSDSEVWAKAHASAQAAVEKARQEVDAECERLGIPRQFRPGLHMFWTGRGENACKDRRAELRRVAKAEIEKIEAKAKTAIQVVHLQARVKLTELGLHSDAAREFLAALPSVESMMPPLVPENVERIMLTQARQDPYYRRKIGADVDDEEEDEERPRTLPTPGP